MTKHDWAEIDKKLGTTCDRDIADEFDIERQIIANRRIKLGIPRLGKWTEHEHLLGIVPDCKIAEMLGITPNAVTQKRLRSGISAHHKGGELKLEHDFIESLGVKCERQITTSLGRIDVLTKDTIYECKYHLDTSSVHKALGQLFCFSILYPGRKLAIVCRESVLSSRWSQVFEAYGIEVIEMPVQE